MGCSINWKLAYRFAALGLTSVKPKVGVGNGSSYGYCYHMRRVENFAGYALTEKQTLDDVLERIESRRLTSPRSLHLLEMIGGEIKFEDCNTLYLWDRDDNPRCRRKYYCFLKTPRDVAIFKIFLDETDPKIWNEDSIGKPYVQFNGY